MRIEDTVAVITGASSSLGHALALELAARNVHGLALVDPRESAGEIAHTINERAGDWICHDFCGDLMDPRFREKVYRETARHCGRVNVCVPVPPIRPTLSPAQATETRFICPLQWAREMIDFIAADRGEFDRQQSHEPIRGMVVLISPDALTTRRAHKISPKTRAVLTHATARFVAEADGQRIGCAVLLLNDNRQSEFRTAGLNLETLFPSIRVQPQTDPAEIAQAIGFVIESSLSNLGQMLPRGFPYAARHISDGHSPHFNRRK